MLKHVSLIQMKMGKKWNFVFLNLFVLFFSKAKGDDQEYRLVRYLMSNYDPAVRPSLSAAHPLHVHLRLSLLHLVGLDESSGIMTTNCRITLKWNDVHLRWNASDFGGVGSVRIPSTQVWRPDVLLSNNADGAISGNAHLVVWSSGDILWRSQSLYRSSCPLDLELFPFDIHVCHLNFTSWSYDVAQVTLTTEQADVSSFQPHHEFHLQETVEGVVLDSSRPTVGYALVLKRRPGSHLLRLVLPCFLINTLAAFCFCIPPSSAERVTLATGALIAMLLLFAAGPRIPQSPRTPLLGVYQTASLLMVASAAFLSALTLGLHQMGVDGALPTPCLEKCLLVRRGSSEGERHKKKSADKKRGDEEPALRVERWTSSPQQLLSRRRSEGRSSDEFEKRFLRVLDRVHETLERNEAKDIEREAGEAAKQEWRKIAQVTDRVLVAVFLTGAFLAPSLLFAFAPL